MTYKTVIILTAMALVLTVSSVSAQEIREVGFYDTPGTAYAVFVVGDLAYVADHDAGLRVIDVSDPENPDEVGFYDTPGRATDVFVAGDLAYVADLWEGLRVIDVSDPENLNEVGFYKTPDYSHGIFVAGDLAYVADRLSGLRMIDVSDPENPDEIGFYDTPGGATDVFVAGDLAFVADGEGGLRVIDVSDLENPDEIGFYDMLERAYNVFVAGDLAFVADWFGGLRVIDVSDPENPDEIGFYDTSARALAVFVTGDQAYVADGEGGLRVIDVSDPENPDEVAFYDMPEVAVDVLVLGDLAYMAYGQSGLRIFDISDFTTPQPEISVTPEMLDFGEVEICDSKELTLTIYNGGNQDLVIPEILVDNDCFSTIFEDEMVIVPDEEWDLTVTFAPEEVGDFEGMLIIISNDEDNGEIQVELHGVGIECEIEYLETVLWAQNSMWFKQGAEVLSGNIWVNEESEGPFLNSNCPLSVGTRVQIATDIELKGDFIKVNPHAVIDAEVTYNRLENNGTINGDLITPLELPISVMPDFPEFECGDESIEVPRNGNIELEAGIYGHLRVERGGTVTFTGGVYTFQSINSRDNSNLIFLEESEIRVKDKFVTETSVYVGPDEDGSITARDIVFYVESQNGNNGRLGSSPKAAAIGMSNNWHANIYVPNGTLWIRHEATAEGSFIARDIIVGIGASVTFNGGFVIAPSEPDQIQIQLMVGWNFISTNVVPLLNMFEAPETRGPDVELMFEQLRAPNGEHSVILVIDYSGCFWFPRYEFNSIAYWNLTNGLRVLVLEVEQIIWDGVRIPPDTDIPLQSGYNLIAYYPEYDLNAHDFYPLSPIIDNVVIAKDDSGRFMLPEYNFSNMNPWHAGEAYIVEMAADAVLNYPDDPGEAPVIFASGDHWEFTIATVTSMSVLVTKINGPEGFQISAGDQIGAFNQNDEFVGYGDVIDGECGIAVWGIDQMQPNLPGVDSEEEFRLVYWDEDREDEIEIEDVDVVFGEGLTYLENSYIVLEIFINDMVLDPEELISQLKDYLLDLYNENEIDEENFNLLCEILDSALDILNGEDIEGAIDCLNQFVEEVEQAAPDNISEILADELITMAQHIIDQLSNIAGGAPSQKLTISDPLPSDYYLSKAYPNPFNAVTRLSFGVLEASRVIIGVHDMSGRLVARLVDAELEAGHHTAVWDVGSVPNGVYLMRMEAADFNVVRKAILMR
ncbi:MAG: DUF1573 domain-containing protein [Candidatus Hatepunaea meridiana]|nr:DUF1573 domain-containing protein [Candidatus Hatepunaea meridiana]